MTILENILAFKQKEVAERKSLFPLKLLEQSIYFPGATVSMKKYIMREDKEGIIAEIKRRSPSKGIINPHFSVEEASIGFMQAGASGLSVLTDQEFFGGKNEDLTDARKYNFCPILRKDFIIDEYQIVEAKSIGADVILLIAAALEPNKLESLAEFAQTLELEVLLEVHDKEEVRKYAGKNIDIIGVNNRDLKTFETKLEVSARLSEYIPHEFVKISESGIYKPEDVFELRNYGYQGFLIGENFMRYSRPWEACSKFIHALQGKKTVGRQVI